MLEELNAMIESNESLYDCVLVGDLLGEEDMVLSFVESDEMWEFRG